MSDYAIRTTQDGEVEVSAPTAHGAVEMWEAVTRPDGAEVAAAIQQELRSRGVPSMNTPEDTTIEVEIDTEQFQEAVDNAIDSLAEVRRAAVGEFAGLTTTED